MPWEEWWEANKQDLEQWCWDLHLPGLGHNFTRSVIASWQMHAIAAWVYPLARADLVIEIARLTVECAALRLRLEILTNQIREDDLLDRVKGAG